MGTDHNLRFYDCLQKAEKNTSGNGKNSVESCTAQFVMSLFGLFNLIPTLILIFRYVRNKGGYKNIRNQLNIVVMSTIALLNLFTWFHFFISLPPGSVLRQSQNIIWALLLDISSFSVIYLVFKKAGKAAENRFKWEIAFKMLFVGSMVLNVVYTVVMFVRY